MAYTALLELAHADLVWMVRFRPSFCELEQFIRGTLSDSIALLEKVAKHRGSEFIVPHHVGFLKEMKTDHLRTGSAKRQQRFREGRGKGNS